LTEGDTDDRSTITKPRWGVITPGEAARIAAVVDRFARANETTDLERRLKIVEGETRVRPVKMPEMFGTGLGGQFNP
jgi:hypothetical protein